jgi:VanZ family protein
MRFLRRSSVAWIPVGLYAGGIFLLSSLSHPPSLPAWELPHLDKLFHTLQYGGLTFLLIRALCLTDAARPATHRIVWGAFLAIIYGALDELHQAFTPGRTMSVYDLLADATGAAMMAGVWLTLQRCWPRLVKS